MLVERKVPSCLRDASRRKRRSVRVSSPGNRRSLDSVNHLATSASETVPESFVEWSKRLETAQDRRRKLYSTHDALLESLKVSYHHEELVRQRAILEEMTTDQTYWQSAHKAMKARRWSATKDYDRVATCQTLWKAFRSQCCTGRTLAVPVGCNHRLCPLCSAHRAEHYRERVMGLFSMPRTPATETEAEVPRNWQLLTLTVPNCRKLSTLTLSILRMRIKRFLKKNLLLLLGGVYSIEITRNRARKDWHPHVHMLVDVDGDGHLPYEFFCYRKWQLEFDWFLLTQGNRNGRRRWNKADFAEWMEPLNPTTHGKPFSPMWVKRYAGRREGDRRSVDIRPVSTDKKAAYEVMKYMTKVSFFVDDPQAVAEFLTAVKGVRAIQTFGNCYGFKLDKKSAKASLSCECGKNDWKDIGFLGLGMVEMSPDGSWHVRDDAPVHGLHARRACRGKPT